jgi:very-short-patch-repair endonuclease
MMSRYGVKYTFQNEDFYKKSKETLFKNYGVFNPYENKEILDRAQKKRKNTIKNNKILNQDNNIIDVDYDTREYLMNCDVGKNHTFKISFELYKSRKQFANYKCTECFPEHFNQTSMSEFELLNFIQKHYKDEIVVNSKKIIYPFELDIYLPEINIAFEFNGIYWHDEQHKSSDYHLKKTELCDENGIKLIHIWEDDWMYKNDIVKSNILNILSIKTNIIDVNDCDIKEITNSEVIKDFLEKNHIQGFIDSQIKIGLYHNNELISLMNFENNIESYELLRFCNKLNTNIIGGYDKLFKYFVINYEPTEIIAYFDRSWSYDKIYENLGFELVHKSQSNYSYVIDGIRKNRFNFGKSILIKEGYSSEKTESEIMLERKIYRIYDSGQLKFIWKDKQI